MTHLRKGDEDLHHPDGTHRTTPKNTRGRALENHERRLRKHLAEHGAPPDGPEKWVPEAIAEQEAYLERRRKERER